MTFFSQKIIVRYSEIFLKSFSVFKTFEKKLLSNISKTLSHEGINFEIENERGRIFLTVKKADIDKALSLLGNVFGVKSYSLAYYFKLKDLDQIKKICSENFANFVKKGETFAVRARRVGFHSFTSQDVEREVGNIIKGKVDLKNPKKEIFIEIRHSDVFIFTQIIPGLGGLPVSCSGKVLSFLSGGIDSPVSSFLAMKRGCKVIFLHFHSFPLVSKKSIDKTKTIVEKLNKYQLGSKLILVPFHKIQLLLKVKAPPKYLIVLYRRSMARIGQEIAKKEKAKAIFTGESLAQVSSQTLENLNVINESFNLPVLRPLISMDKQEIIDLAKKIGTYEISILPQEDCCQIFVSGSQTTRAKLDVVKKIEKNINIKKIEKRVLQEIEEIIFRF
jgi:thiamine biosynthesis protein ThiI